VTRTGSDPRAPVRRGFLTVDAAGALGLVMLMLVFFAYSTTQLRRSQQDSTLRRGLRLAAENELSRIRAGLEPLPPPGQSRTRVRGAMTLRITAEPGAGDWAGLVLLHIVAVADGRDARATPGAGTRFELAGYVPAGDSP
jgi:hypothetical protein